MRNLVKVAAMMTVVLSTALMYSCSKSDPSPLTLVSLTANGVDLNGATSPSDVPADAIIIATFSGNVDPATATAVNLTLVRDYDGEASTLDISVAGPVVTITPSDDMLNGALYVLTAKSGLRSADGGAFTEASRNFTTEGTFAPDGVIAHWTFENSTDDVVGSFDPQAADVHDITYVDSRNTAAGKAASFNGTTSIAEAPNADQLLSHGDFTLSFWVKANSTKNGQFVLGLGAWKGFQFEIAGDWAWVKLATQYTQGDGTKDSEDAWFPGNGQTKDNGGWQGWTFQKDLSPASVGDTYFKDKWAHVVVAYEAATKLNTMYINGEKVKQHDFNLWPAGEKKKTITGVGYAGNAAPGNKLAFGFIQGSANRIITDTWADPSDPANNHFKGYLDDVRVFSRAVTATEVLLMYNSEK